MRALHKVFVGVAALFGTVIVGFSMYVWLVLPSCTLMEPNRIVSPNENVVAVVQARRCESPRNDWVRVMLHAREGGEAPVVFELLESSGPISVQWDSSSRLEIRYPRDAKTRQTPQLQGWPSVKYLPEQKAQL